MKKFSRSLFLFFLFPFLGLLILVILHIILPLTSDYDYDGGLKIKHELLLKNKKQKKIVFVGGSNLAQGLDSKKIQDNFSDYKIINYGQRFDTGLEFYLDEISNYLGENDIVIIVPEYEMILNNYFGNLTLTRIWLEGLNAYPLENYTFDIRSVIDYSIYRISLLINLQIGSFPKQNSTNNILGFNEFGDFTFHWFWKHKKFENYNEVISFNHKKSTFGKVTKFLALSKTNSIKVLVVPPITAKSHFLKINKLVNFNNAFWLKSGQSYSCNPNDMVIDDSFFYDSPYHLLYQGVQIKTDKIIQILKHFIN
jgi:hypothetical protein